MRTPCTDATPLPGFHGLVGQSAPMQALFREIEALAPVDVPVLILGETGTGKELVARTLHDLSPRRAAPFQPLHCGALPRDLLPGQLFGHEKGAFTGAVGRRPGLLREAHGGTVFLDEVGELTPEAQVLLLRFLQDGEIQPIGAPRPVHVDVRVLAATHRDLAAWVDEGRFREDLYQRLCWAVLEVPPLRARLDDLPLLVEHCRRGFNARFGCAVDGLTPPALTRLAAAAWRGNVRELETALGRTITRKRSGWIGPEDLSLGPTPRGPEPLAVDRSRGDRRSTPPRTRRGTALVLAANPGGVTSGWLAAACGISGELARRELAALVRGGRLRRLGRGPATRYVLP